MGGLNTRRGEVKENNVLIVGIRHLQNFFAGIHIPARIGDKFSQSKARNTPLHAKARLGETKEIVHRNEIDKCISNIAPYDTLSDIIWQRRMYIPFLKSILK